MVNLWRRFLTYVGASRAALAGALVVAALIRLDNVTQPFIDNYGWRQASVAMMAQNYWRTSWNIFYPEVNWTGPGPGYQGREFQTVSYLAALLYTILGQHDWIGRAISIAFGLLAIFSLYQLVRIVWDEQRAVVAAWILAVSPEGARIDRAFIPDPAMVSLVVTSFWLWVRYLETGRRRWLSLAWAIGTLGVLTKIPGMIIGLPIAYCSLVILRRRGELNRATVYRIVSAAAASGLIVAAYYLWARHLSQTYPPYHFSGEGNWVWHHGLRAWLAQGYFLPFLWAQLKLLWTAWGLGLGIAGFMLPFLARSVPSRLSASWASFRTPWVFHWWMAAVVFNYLIGATELLENRSNFHIMGPAVAALAAHAVVSASRLVGDRVTPRLFIPCTIAMLALLALSAEHHRRMHESYAQQSYAIGRTIATLRSPNELSTIIGNAIGCPIGIFYTGGKGWTFPAFEDVADWNELPTDQDAIQKLENVRTRGAVWLGIVADRQREIWDARPEFAAHLERTAEIVQVTQDGLVLRLLPPVETLNVR